MSVVALQAITTKLAADVATLVAQEATTVPQADVDSITNQLTSLDNTVVAAITPAPAAPAAPSAS